MRQRVYFLVEFYLLSLISYFFFFSWTSFGLGPSPKIKTGGQNPFSLCAFFHTNTPPVKCPPENIFRKSYSPSYFDSKMLSWRKGFLLLIHSLFNLSIKSFLIQGETIGLFVEILKKLVKLPKVSINCQNQVIFFFFFLSPIIVLIQGPIIFPFLFQTSKNPVIRLEQPPCTLHAPLVTATICVSENFLVCFQLLEPLLFFIFSSPWNSLESRPKFDGWRWVNSNSFCCERGV